MFLTQSPLNRSASENVSCKPLPGNSANYK